MKSLFLSLSLRGCGGLKMTRRRQSPGRGIHRRHSFTRWRWVGKIRGGWGRGVSCLRWSLEPLCIGVHWHVALISKIWFGVCITNVDGQASNGCSVTGWGHVRIAEHCRRWGRGQRWDRWWHPVSEILFHKLILRKLIRRLAAVGLPEGNRSHGYVKEIFGSKPQGTLIWNLNS